MKQKWCSDIPKHYYLLSRSSGTSSDRIAFYLNGCDYAPVEPPERLSAPQTDDVLGVRVGATALTQIRWTVNSEASNGLRINILNFNT